MGYEPYATVASLPSLVRNGGFEAGVAFWELTNASVTDYGVSVVLQSEEVASLKQSFQHGSISITDSQPAGTLRSLPSGYLPSKDVTFPPGKYTVSLDVFVVQGAAIVELLSSSAIALLSDASVAAHADTRVVFSFEALEEIADIEIRVSRVQEKGLLEAKCARVSMCAGAYGELPYLIDGFTAAFPPGAIILTAGTVCPPGFEALPDTLEPLSEWVGHNPQARGMVGNFVRGGTTQVGTEQHTTDPGGTLSLSSEVDLPGANNPDALALTGVDFKNSPIDSGEHVHTLGGGGTRPVAWAFQLCRRL